jgi:SAM-dependent methyltransferase
MESRMESPATLAPDHPYRAELERQAATWERKASVRALYGYWFEKIEKALTPEDPVVEIGCGCGAFRNYLKSRGRKAIGTDALPTPWCDQVADARKLPFEDNSVGNLVAMDVLHHIPDPLTPLKEAARVLKPGGRMVFFEPYGSIIGGWVYRLFHHEPFDWNYDVMNPPPFKGREGEFANDAIPGILFFKVAKRWPAQVPGLKEVSRTRFTGLSYLLVGGFSYRGLMPAFAARGCSKFEDFFLEHGLGAVFALRTMVVLEKQGGSR